jgi:6-pyruvoyltetrahydropterin/6-carboxytetrahydropterin synthase
MLITRKAEFSASHVCAQPSLTFEQNLALYGLAANPNGHGHNYVVEITLEGDPDPETGMVFDLKHFKEIIHKTVIEPMDHRFLNYEVPPFDKIVPTAENVAAEIWNRLEPSFDGSRAHLHNVRLYETEELYVDYRGESQ